jgi:MFS family permease
MSWRPHDVVWWTGVGFGLGSLCFAVAATASQWASAPRRAAPEWRMAALNMLGSIAFGVAAVASLVEPSDSEPVSAAVANAGTALGALLFLAGALVLIASSYVQLGATPGPARASERTSSR